METDRRIQRPGWWDVALRPDIVRRALTMSAVVGTLLMLINHGDSIWRGEVGGWRMLRIGLTYLVPFTVSTLSSTAAIRSTFPITAPDCRPSTENPTHGG